MEHPHHKHLDSALKRVGEPPKSPSGVSRPTLAEPHQQNTDAAIPARRADLISALYKQGLVTRRKLAQTRRTRLHSFMLADGRRAFPED